MLKDLSCVAPATRDLSATEVARNLSEVLDAVEHRHESFRITRGGRVIARVTPEEPALGRAVKDFLARRRVDPAWGRDLAELRAPRSDQRTGPGATDPRHVDPDLDGAGGGQVIEAYTPATDRTHAALLGWATGSGSPRGAHDLMIAATAVAMRRAVCTADVRGFEGLPGVEFIG